MHADGKFPDTPNRYKSIAISDKEAFRVRVFDAISGMQSSRDSNGWKKWRKGFFLGFSILLLPITGYAAYHAASWGGEEMNFAEQNMSPVSQVANPMDPYSELHVTAQRLYDLAASRSRAIFPIREPAVIAGWVRIASKGVAGREYIVQGHSGSQKPTVLAVTRTPLRYVDIYVNQRGQRIAVTQQYDETGTNDLRRFVDGDASNGSGWILGKNATVVRAFHGSNFAFVISGNWRDNPARVPFRGTFENLVLLHKEKNKSVTRVIIDEYGNVSLSVLEFVARDYLNARTAQDR